MDVFQLSKTKKKLRVYDGEKITYFLHEYMFKISNLCSPKFKYCFQYLPKKKIILHIIMCFYVVGILDGKV